MLSSTDIHQALKMGRIKLNPLYEKCIQPASVDIHLSAHFRFYKEGDYAIDLHDDIESLLVDGFADMQGRFAVAPKQFVLAATIEIVGLNKEVVARIDGKSSIGRSGLFVQNAGFIDPGFEGTLTLEFFNATDHPIIVHYGDEIGQIAFFNLVTATEYGYGDPNLQSRYQGQTEPTGSRYGRGRF